MRTLIFLFFLLFTAMSLTAQDAPSRLSETNVETTRQWRLSTDNGTKMQVTIVNADGSRRMDFIKISENADYIFLELPTANVRYSKKYDVVDQRDGDFTIRLLSNAWVKCQLIYDGKELTAIDGAVIDFNCETSTPNASGGNDLTGCKSVRLYSFEYGD
jgi:hypothetical protein